MCIIIYKPEDVDLPDYDRLKLCFEHNPDGCGYMFVDNGKVHIRKGYTDFVKFYADLTNDNYRYTSPFVLHFRIATHGAKNEQNTHPFAVSKHMNDLLAIDYQTDVGLAHNGVLSITSNYSNCYSDTMNFITEYLSLLIKDDIKYYENADYLYIIKDLIGFNNKLAILSSNKHCELLGDFIKDGGCFYSNNSYKKQTYSKSGHYKYRSLYNEYWDKCYIDARKGYDFDENFCPFTCDDCSLYCESCLNKNKCVFHKNKEV